MRLKYTLFILFIVLLGSEGKSQDFYFDHYDANPQMLNPALTGMYFSDNLDYRLNFNFGTQRLGVSSAPFMIGAIGADFSKKSMGFGGNLTYNQAGEGSYASFNLLLGFAYNISIDPTGRHHLMTGVQLGITQTGFDETQLRFESQYSSELGGFDPNLSSNETYKSNVFGIDGGLGVFYRFRDKRKFINPYVGYALYHVTQSNVQFSALSENSTPIRYNLYGGLLLNINRDIKAEPHVLMNYQGDQLLLTSNLFVHYRVNSQYEAIVGVGNRFDDAPVFHLGLKQRKNIYRVSYSIPNKDLSAFSNGTIEFSVIWAKISRSDPSFNKTMPRL